MSASSNAMREKPVLPLLLSLSLPVMLSMLMQSLYNIIDGWWVTKLGTDALTAVSLAFPLQNIVLSVGVGMGVGISSLMAIQLGSGKREQASRIASTGMMLALFHCVLFVLGGLFLTRPFLQMFTDDPVILEQACDYTQIVLCFSFGHLLQMGIEKIYHGAGKTVITMFMVLTGCILNIILDPILIFGWFGLPAMGVRGAAIATIIGQIVPFCLYIILYLHRNPGVSISPKYVVWDWGMIRKIYAVGIPSALVLAMPSLLSGALNGILFRYGSVYVAVFGLYIKLQTLVSMPTCGVIQGMRPIISQNYGARSYGRVRRTIACSIKLVAGINLAGTLLAVLFPEQILHMFEADAELLRVGVPALRIIGSSLFLSSLAVVACGVFEGLGQGKKSLWISLLRQLLLLVPVGWLLSFFWEATGIWIAFPLAETAGLLVSAWALYRLTKTELQERPEQKEPLKTV